MKKLTLIIALALFTDCALQTTSFAGEETNGTYLKVLQASNNVAGIIQALPDVEKLWPQEPVAYLKSVNQAVHVFDGAMNNSNANQAFLDLFASMMQKSCPTNEEAAATWIELKQNITLLCMNADALRNDKSQWLAVAKFLGEVRSKKISNYTNQGLLNAAAPGDSPQQVQEEIAANERRKITDNYQSQLWQAESTLMFQLQYNCPFIQPNKTTDTNFISQISSAAHLTKEEGEKLRGKNN